MNDIVFLFDSEICNLEMMDKSAANEILIYKKNYLRKHKKRLIDFVTENEKAQENEPENVSLETEESLNATEQFNLENEISSQSSLHYITSLLLDNDTKEQIIEFTKAKNTEIKDLNVSTRAYNALRRGGVRHLYEAIFYYPNKFDSFQNVGAKSIDEICKVIEKYVSEHYDEIVKYMNSEGITLEQPEKIGLQQETDPSKLTIQQLLTHPDYREMAERYLKENDIPLEQMGLSKRSTNALMRSNVLSFYDLLSVYPNILRSIRNLGAKSIDEIKARTEYYSSKMQSAVSAYCSGDTSVLYTDKFIFDTVMSCFEDAGFSGLSFKQIRESFPDEFDESRIKKCIGKLLANKQFEYVDFRLYRVYPSVYTVIQNSSFDDKDKEVLLKRLNGMTLEDIAKDFGVTRERIRQKCDMLLRKLKGELLTKYGFNNYDEDYYAYLYSNYEVIKELWSDFIGVPTATFNFLLHSKSKGERQISEALSDPKIDLILKFKIQDYLNRNKILIDGRMIEKRRSDIEDYALSKIARDELSYDEFAEQYNELLQQNGIDFDEKLYYTDKTRRGRLNKFAASMHCLWKQGEKLRYYDIAGHDYGELLDTINLESFSNIEISTLKLFNSYPETMRKYDIRDQYELHNLLRKVVDPSKYNGISFNRQPMICFGTFDRKQAIYDIIAAFSPITADELAEYVYSEYGYDKGTACASYFQPFKEYYHQGVYSVEFKRIPYDRIEVLRAELTEEFYYISEIKTLYKKLFENADAEEINTRSLKSLGYNVFASYVLKNYTTSDAYFRDLLNSEDVFSLKEFNKKFGRIGAYTSVLYDMRKNYDILLFEDGQYINFRKIEKLGITKDDIKKYCDDIYDQIDENQYFTIHSLSGLEINTKLESLGFDKIFFAEILAMSTKFLYSQFLGEFIFYKGQNLSSISKKSFILSQLSNYDDVEIDQFKDDCFDMFGIRITDKYEITNAIADTSYYYDEIMDKVYRNKNFYYSEFED